MVHGNCPLISRSLTVWVLVTATVVVCWAWVGSVATSLASSAMWNGTFEGVLVAIAAAALVVATGWLWLITTLTVADLVRGHVRVGHGLTRRLVLSACGAAVIAGVASPALAGGGSQQQGLAGLPLPDRAVAGASTHQSPHAAPRVAVPHVVPRVVASPPSRDGRDSRATITVRTGDSLWSIARADLGPAASVGEVDARWRALYAANHDEIGDDPDLIRPGQRLRPGAPTSRTDR